MIELGARAGPVSGVINPVATNRCFLVEGKMGLRSRQLRSIVNGFTCLMNQPMSITAGLETDEKSSFGRVTGLEGSGAVVGDK